jgi:hypothetical protein
MRKKLGKKARQGQSPAPTQPAAEQPVVRVKRKELELLEEKIDECMVLARQTDAEGLAGVVKLLRRARNEVVWKGGQTGIA